MRVMGDEEHAQHQRGKGAEHEGGQQHYIHAAFGTADKFRRVIDTRAPARSVRSIDEMRKATYCSIELLL